MMIVLFGGALAGAAYLLGTQYGGRWAGAIAAALLVTSPTFLTSATQHGRDIPCAALWAIALWAAARPGVRHAALAGMAAALALAIRPNLVPLAAIVSAIAALRANREWRPAAAFATPLAIALIAAPLLSSYRDPALDALYAGGSVAPHLQHLVTWLSESQTPLIFLSLAVPFLALGGHEDRTDQWVLFLSAVAFPLMVAACYLFYFSFDEWDELHFVLPAFAPLLAATGAALVQLGTLAPRRIVAIIGISCLVIGVAAHGLAYEKEKADLRVRLLISGD